MVHFVVLIYQLETVCNYNFERKRTLVLIHSNYYILIMKFDSFYCASVVCWGRFPCRGYIIILHF